MAVLTTNISSVSLTVSGTTEQSTTISWTLPTIPSGATISSCVLTGTATASMTKGSATITVNGTSVSSGSSFSIDLGTNNTTSSVTATTTGNNKNAAGTVTFSNLVYTVTYTEPVQVYTVTFVDWDGTVLKTEKVESGNSATAPSEPSRTGYNFTGWDISFDNVTSDLTVTAQYEQLYLVTFIDYDDSVLKTEYVAYGGSATAPSVTRYGYEFIGWSVDFSNVTSNITTVAQYKALSILKIKENDSWINIPQIYKKVSGSWVEHVNDSWSNLFDSSVFYVKKERSISPTAILYSDGYFVFSNYDDVDSTHGDIIAMYTGWDTEHYDPRIKYSPWYDDRLNIIKVYFTNTSSNSASTWFMNCENLSFIDLSNFDASRVSHMTNMFRGCTKLTSLDLSSLNTNNVISTEGMFYTCNNLKSINLSNFNTSKVGSMSYMFYLCTSLTSLDLSSFDTSKVADMSYMFRDCTSLTSLDLSSFNTSKVTNMSYMFNDCTSLTSLDLSSFDTSMVTNMTYMFEGCTNPNLTIYVKDEDTKTKIESSSGFPTTATVVIGSMN